MSLGACRVGGGGVVGRVWIVREVSAWEDRILRNTDWDKDESVVQIKDTGKDGE